METNFSKGKWVCNKSIAPLTGIEGEIEISTTYKSVVEWIALCNDSANAKLISAAPDLLEVALKCLEWCNGCQSVEFVNSLRIQSENAIRKAVGSDFLA